MQYAPSAPPVHPTGQESINASNLYPSIPQDLYFEFHGMYYGHVYNNEFFITLV